MIMFAYILVELMNFSERAIVVEIILINITKKTRDAWPALFSFITHTTLYGSTANVFQFCSRVVIKPEQKRPNDLLKRVLKWQWQREEKQKFKKTWYACSFYLGWKHSVAHWLIHSFIHWMLLTAAVFLYWSFTKLRRTAIRLILWKGSQEIRQP